MGVTLTIPAALYRPQGTRIFRLWRFNMAMICGRTTSKDWDDYGRVITEVNLEAWQHNKLRSLRSPGGCEPDSEINQARAYFHV